MKFLHTALHVSSKENAKRFYEELLGLRPAKETGIKKELASRIFGTDNDFDIRLYDAGGAFLEVFIGGAFNRPSPVNHICLWIDEREALKEKALQMGFRVVEIEREGTYNLLFLHDDDGNAFEIKG